MRTEATPATEVAKASTPLYESPIKGVRVESRRRTRRILSWLWLTQVAASIIIPSAFALLGYREWAEIPGRILMLLLSGTIAIVPFWFMAGRALLDKNEGWELPDSRAKPR